MRANLMQPETLAGVHLYKVVELLAKWLLDVLQMILARKIVNLFCINVDLYLQCFALKHPSYVHR